MPSNTVKQLVLLHKPWGDVGQINITYENVLEIYWQWEHWPGEPANPAIVAWIKGFCRTGGMSLAMQRMAQTTR